MSADVYVAQHPEHSSRSLLANVSVGLQSMGASSSMHLQAIKFREVPSVEAEVRRRIVNGVVYNNDGVPVPVVHQWDRMQNRKKRIVAGGRNTTLVFNVSFRSLEPSTWAVGGTGTGGDDG